MTGQPDQQPAPAPLHVFLSDAAGHALGALQPGELDAVEKLIERLTVHPRLGIPVPGGTDPEVDDYTARTDPAADTGDRISLVYRVHSSMAAVFVTWVIAGP
ncbi:hypothetical protein ACIQF6_34110 [Kitasatospora sp. NPDC092948]|uniref:hypothetical protein n=1 Tax=Kitasatospora sp. NPDC092948 TaxID=3364088 RepID=UPI003819589D